jgi:hypothetical protein
MKPLPNETFFSWFARLNLAHFKAHELVWYFSKARYGVSNSYPPRHFWPNIITPLRVLDQLRSDLDQPISIHSTYRSPKYNSVIGGAPASRHLHFNAIDFSVRNTSPKRVAAELRKLRTAGLFRGGIGTYRTFVHLDTRGHNADW